MRLSGVFYGGMGVLRYLFSRQGVHVAQRIWARQQLLMSVTVSATSGRCAEGVILKSSKI